VLNDDRRRDPVNGRKNYEKNRSKHEAKLNRSDRDAIRISIR
jgi:hypothetical protein